MKKELRLALRVSELKPSATVEMTERVRQAQQAGANIIPLSSGDPNIATHPAIIEAAHRSLLAGETHYGPAAGKPSLREAIAHRIEQNSGVSYDSNEILVTPGGKFGVFISLLAVVEPGDEVIMLEPGWVSYGPCINLAGGVCVTVPALDEIDPERLAKAITPRTRMIIVNSPVNPTGRIIPVDELTAIVDLAERYGLWILFDEVYSEIVFEPNAYTSLQSLEGARQFIFVVNSFSKTFGMTGWRVGYLAAPAPIAKTVLKIVQHSVYCLPLFIQAAAETALSLPKEVVEGYISEFRRRRDVAANRLNKVQGIHCNPPPATFYLFPSIKGDDREVAKEWLDQLSIAVLPGSAFGSAGKGHLRISIACDMPTLNEALHRIERHYGS